MRNEAKIVALFNALLNGRCLVDHGPVATSDHVSGSLGLARAREQSFLVANDACDSCQMGF